MTTDHTFDVDTQDGLWPVEPVTRSRYGLDPAKPATAVSAADQAVERRRG
jgi:hypothetical protein